MPSPHPLSLHVETKTQSTADGAGCLSPRLVIPLVGVSPFASPLGPFCLLASYALRASSVHQLAPASYRPAPRLIDKRDGAKRKRDRLRASDGGRLLACLPRMATGCGRSSMADGCGHGRWRGVLACLGAMDGAARSFLDRSSFPSSSHPIGSAPAPSHLSHHLIERGETFFSFSPDPLPSALLGLLALTCSPVPGRGM